MPVEAGAEAGRRNPRQVAVADVDVGFDRVAEAAQLELADLCFRQLHAGFGLDAPELGVRLAPDLHRQTVFDVAGAGEIHEVLDVVVEHVGAEMERPGVLVNTDIDVVRGFLAQRRVADFEGLGGDVRPVGEQFFLGRPTLGQLPVGAGLPLGGEAPDRAGRKRQKVEIARAGAVGQDRVGQADFVVLIDARRPTA